MQIEITKIRCVRGWTDILYIDTTLPNGIWPYNGAAYFRLEVGTNMAEKYCEENFPGVPLEVKCGG